MHRKILLDTNNVDWFGDMFQIDLYYELIYGIFLFSIWIDNARKYSFFNVEQAEDNYLELCLHLTDEQIEEFYQMEESNGSR